MSFWRHRLDQNTNEKFEKILPQNLKSGQLISFYLPFTQYLRSSSELSSQSLTQSHLCLRAICCTPSSQGQSFSVLFDLSEKKLKSNNYFALEYSLMNEPKIDTRLFVDCCVFYQFWHDVIKQFYDHLMPKLVKTYKNRRTIRC